MFGLNIFSSTQKIKQKSNFLVISGSSLHFLSRCSKFFSKKRIHNTFQIRIEKTQTTRFFNNEDKFVDFRTKWIVLPYSKLFSKETKYIEAKLHPFSGKQEYNKTNSTRNICNILVFFPLAECETYHFSHRKRKTVRKERQLWSERLPVTHDSRGHRSTC